MSDAPGIQGGMVGLEWIESDRQAVIIALGNELTQLKEKLLTMASHAEQAVVHAVKALMRRDDDLARRTREEDGLIDRLEMEIDDLALRLLAQSLPPLELRLITTAMKIAHDLERVGDEATTISRRVLELSREPQLPQARDIPPMATESMQLLKESLDAYVHRAPDRARLLIPRDKEVDRQNKRIHQDLSAYMADHPDSISRCLNLMVVAKCLERIGDHAKNVAEMVVYMCEGMDIRHAAQGGT